MMNKAREKGVAAEKILFFPNWSEVARFQDVNDADVTALRQQLGLSEGKKIVLYSGNIGEKQGLEKVIDAAERLRDRPLIFAIVGGGAARRGWRTWPANAACQILNSSRCSLTTSYPRC